MGSMLTTPVFVILPSIFALTPAPIHAYSHTLPHTLAHSCTLLHTPAHANAQILTGEWQKPLNLRVSTDQPVFFGIFYSSIGRCAGFMRVGTAVLQQLLAVYSSIRRASSHYNLLMEVLGYQPIP